jgi:hypothetical protein
LQNKAEYFENLYANILTTTAKQEELINVIIKRGNITSNTAKKRKEIAV